jgi:6-phosphogluconolactonase
VAATLSGRENPLAERLFVVPSAEELARAAAGRLWGIVRERAAVLARGGRRDAVVRVALSGGETPRRTFEILSSEPYRAKFPWEMVHFFQVDERWVPPEDPSSNFRMLRESLFSRAPVPENNIFRVDTSLPGPEEGARRYEETLRAAFPDLPGGFPRFDAILLGIGKDGHTASLFPGGPDTAGGTAWTVATTGGEPSLPRVTMTLPVLSSAAQVVFLAGGAEKARALRGVLSGDPSLPAARVSPARGKVTFLADGAAAALAVRRGAGERR